MVGPPKTLYDLRRVEASIRLTCTACGWTEERDREQLIHFRTYHRQSCDWEVVQRDSICKRCGTSVEVAGVPFGENAAETRARRAEAVLINLSLAILVQNAPRGAYSKDREDAVRLALRTLHPFVRNQELLATYWRSITEESSTAWNGANQAVRWITATLIERGYPVSASFR